MKPFLIGFAIGATIGVATVVLTTQRSSGTLNERVNATIRDALEAGRRASAAQESQMWSDFRNRLAHKDTPPTIADTSPEYQLPKPDTP
ncbi:MAG: hypothetical protein GFH27_549297n16 [Chloroflexi bacterium AL-W]|nr:hypothetical protein [Chloroflexi bacterium AL-N1]NOK68542.1 hypothetical protein [Chloroflexi bacterium AL-N10]NOK76028.1 hypothetical protein [Chloroflexi bacterium AL-N5]NOK82499.1 hypothetical protein [Chloroflexi bacterium AL-W]NOK92811.1 hypothetical protein [Chloroflexi bacterium AL-N15]